jgi:hypothetical protein
VWRCTRRTRCLSHPSPWLDAAPFLLLWMRASRPGPDEVQPCGIMRLVGVAMRHAPSATRACFSTLSPPQRFSRGQLLLLARHLWWWGDIPVKALPPGLCWKAPRRGEGTHSTIFRHVCHWCGPSGAHQRSLSWGSVLAFFPPRLRLGHLSPPFIPHNAMASWGQSPQAFDTTRWAMPIHPAA